VAGILPVTRRKTASHPLFVAILAVTFILVTGQDSLAVIYLLMYMWKIPFHPEKHLFWLLYSAFSLGESYYKMP
jgi:hypothetical protein